MGAQNTKAENINAPNVKDQKPQVPVHTLDAKKFLRPISFKQRIYQDQRKMKKYNICPDKLTRVRDDNKMLSIMKQKRRSIKSLNFETLSPLIENRKFLKALPSMTSLKAISLEFNEKSKSIEYEAFTKAVGKMKHLSSFNLVCLDPSTLPSEDLARIMSNICRLTRLTKVNLKWISWIHKEPKMAKLESYILKIPQYSHTKTFILDLSTCKNLSDEMVTALAQKLQKMKSLQDLNLDLRFTEGASRFGLRYLLESIAKLNLCTLNLKFGGFEFPGDLVSIRDNVLKLEALETLSLTFEGIDEIAQKGLTSIMEAISRLKRLQNVKIDLSSCMDLTSFELPQFSNQIIRLHLVFKNCQLENDSFIRISEGLAQLSNLKELLLDFEGPGAIEDTLFVKISKSVSAIKLTSLSLNFSKTQVTDSGFLSFADDLSRMYELKRLGLSFQYNSNITDKAILGLKVLTKLTRLTALHFDFYQCSCVSDLSVLYLLSIIEQIKTIKERRLLFKGRNIPESMRQFLWKYNM